MSSSYKKALQHFKDACSDDVFRPQSSAEWPGPFELPLEILDYYQSLGPVDVTIKGHGNPYFLPSLASLWGYQGGYRYDVKTGDSFLEWNPDWLVVADEGGDAFIFSQSSKQILFAYHGEGAWNPTPIFENLGEMAFCLSVLGRIASLNRSHLTDDDSLIKSQHIDSARSLIAAEIGSPMKTEYILNSLGWSR
jgi:hypothetical protein